MLSIVILLGVIGLAACGGGTSETPAAQNTPGASAEVPTNASTKVPDKAPSGTSSQASTDASLDQIIIGLSMYLLVDDLTDPDPAVSSVRSEEDLIAILERMNEIWSQADIRFELATLDTLVVDIDVLQEVAIGNTRALFDRLGETIPFTDTGLISGFYTKGLGGPNGIAPRGFRWFMVIDEPSVFDHRVSSHEVGHILGLQHDLSDPAQLLFSGTNGMKLSPTEIAQTRHVARQLLIAQTQR